MGERYPITEPVIKEALAEKLREELRAFRLTRLLPGYWYSSEAPNYLSVGGATIYGSLDGESILAHVSWTDIDKRIVMLDKKTWAVKWYVSVPIEGNFSLHPEGDRFLVHYYGVGNRVEERLTKDGSLARLLNSTELGPIGYASDSVGKGSTCVYDPRDPEKIWIADPANHVVIRTDWSGKVDKQFGVYGVSGSDDTHLNRPSSVSLSSETWIYTHSPLVADFGNHRVLVLRMSDMTVGAKLPFPYPEANYFTGSIAAVWNGITAYAHYGVFLLDDYLTPHPLMLYPASADPFVPHPSEPFLALTGWAENTIRELDFHDLPKWQYGTPVNTQLFPGTSATANTPVYSPPIVDWFRPRKCILVKPTQGGSLDVEVARFARNNSYWTGDWDALIEAEPLTANKVKRIYIDDPLGICRVKVTLSADGTVNGWANLEGR